MTGWDNRIYELRVAQHLDDRWSAWFADLTIDRHCDGTCTLTGTVIDQSQLYGIIARLRDIGATLVSLRALEGGCRNGVDAEADHEPGSLRDQSSVPARGHDALRHGGS